jgi:hypothetical protein
MNEHNLNDPYPETPSEERERITVRIPLLELRFLQCIRPGRGTMQTTISLFLKGLIDECRKRGITSYDQVRDFERLVIERTAVSVAPNHQPPTPPNVGGTTSPLHPTSQGESNISAITPSGTNPSGSREEGNKNTKKSRRSKGGPVNV